MQSHKWVIGFKRDYIHPSPISDHVIDDGRPSKQEDDVNRELVGMKSVIAQSVYFDIKNT